ncbi:NACHT, LRR and PYD domains-containing protein 12-like isoform X2 [Carassius gibelio]|uniref:NACHT, LRR and PYD domains-containing protein 12-like isoform X2 n=1 Tax=Carassius gibelio TaxID=101364 RepID=UPI0022790179|nr:NACHT, LRR and PYD domains-containing protein 12-like isoform X2 [Carassius gibelio]
MSLMTECLILDSRSILQHRPVIKPFCKKYDQSMNQPQHNTYPGVRQEVPDTLRSNLQQKFERLYEGTAMQRNSTLLNEIYTELYITESESGEISNEHEVRQIETQSRREATEDTAIKCSDIFRPLPGQDKAIRTVLTKGVAGIGKTVSVQKLILDWAEGKENQDIQIIFPLPFREINLMKDKTLSLSDLLHVFFPETKEMEISSDEYKVLFIFDGLDECRLSLDFKSKVKLCNISESASVDELLMNLIVGNLLPSALIWITSRPAAADLIPSECVHRVTEVRGFNQPQKEEYFRKRISDQSLADRIISHLKSSRSLYIMCHIPVFCWISAAVLEKMLSRAESGEIPKTLTQMYTHFLILQTDIKHEKDYEKKVNNEDMILKLGKVAFEQLVKGNLIFYEEDLRECGIDVREASVYSGLCTQIFREELGLYQGIVFCFVHLTIQEHLAALYVHLSWTNHNRNVIESITKQSLLSKVKKQFKLSSSEYVSLSELHQRAVKEALQSKNGHLDLFLRFLLGLSVESHQILLQRIMKLKRSSSNSNEETVEYIKKKIRTIESPEKSINLFHCLNELGDRSLVEEIQQFLKSGNLSEAKFSSSQWSALVFVLLTSEEELNQFHLDKFVKEKNNPENMKVLQKLLTVIKESRSVQLRDCGVTDEGCAALASALRSNPSHLRELDLSLNKLRDSSMKLLSAVLEDHHCKLEKLWLSDCGVTDEGCAALTSALRSNPSHLRELDLSGNKISDSVKLLSDVLQDPHCKLEKLWLSDCGITDEGCAALTSALRSNPSHLRELDLSLNKLRYSVKLLSDVLQDPRCELEKLRLSYCGVTDEGCSALASALRSNPSHLRELDLSLNKLRDSVKLLSDVLQDPRFKLEKLWLRDCGITDEGCAALTSALRSNPSHLRELDLSLNKLRDSVKLLSDVLQDPRCKLEKLWLSNCGVTDEGCAALTSALRSNPSHLRELSLSENKLGDSVKLLFDVLRDPRCKLEKLWLRDCGVTDEGCAALASALRSNPSYLRELYLSGNYLGDSVKLLSDVLQDPHCKLEKLWMSDCGVTNEGCAALASALRSNPSHLRQLSLSWNKLEDSVKLLSDVLQNPHWKLEKLRLSGCGITDDGCAALVSALRSNPSHLRELNLSGNKLRDSVKLLSDLLQDPRCNLETLWLRDCGVTDEGCSALASALRSNPSHLRDLNLSENKLRDSVKLLSDVLQDPRCKLEKLWLRDCGVTDEDCAALTSALRSNPSHLRELDLSENKLRDSVKLLSDVLQDPRCKLEKLWLSDCGVTDEGCSALTSALRSNPSHLRELYLSGNKLRDSVKLLSDVLQDPRCKLEKLRLRDCGVTDEGCSALASALRSNPSHLRELNLSSNKLRDSSLKLLSDLKKDPRYKLETLLY